MKVKFLRDEQDILAFFPETLQFFKINETTKYMIECISEGASFEELQPKGITQETYDTIKTILNEKNVQEVNEEYEEKKINKLVLHITNKCNLKCEYCYANGGNYQSEESIMTVEVAKRALDAFFNEMDSIQLVQLFGGEPTLNLPLVRYICEYVSKQNAQSEMKTRIGIVTNGTLITDEFIQLVKEYGIGVTVSYDGVPIVNDRMRKYKDGRGTSDIILENIKKLKAETGQPRLIEITYNQHHVEQGITIKNIADSIHESVGIIPLHIVPAGGVETYDYILKDKEAFIQSVDDIFQDKNRIGEYNYALVERILKAFINREYHSYICEAGTKTFSVSSKGEVYPCFIVTDNKELKMGSVFDDTLFQSEQYQYINGKFRAFNKKENQKCKECLARVSCNGCLGINYLETGSMFQLSDSICDMIQKMTERVIIQLYRLSTLKE